MTERAAVAACRLRSFFTAAEHARERRMVGPGDAILIPPGAHHKPPSPTPVVLSVRTKEATLSLLLRGPYTHEDTYLE